MNELSTKDNQTRQKGTIHMDKTNSRYSGHVLAAALGALGGGLIMLWATKAVPKMMSQMMAGMTQNMMAQMKENGSCTCSEM